MIYISPPVVKMAYNIYKQLPKFREYLKECGLSTVDIPRSLFTSMLMIYFGMNKATAIRWRNQFCEVGLIEEKDNIINFKEGV